MHLSIQLQDGSRPFRFQNVRKSSIEGNFLCVFCHDHVVNRFALEHIKEFRLENGEPPLDTTTARLRVKVWLKNTSGNEFVYAESTDEYGPFYRVKSRGSVVCYHRSSISFVQEEPLVKTERKPSLGSDPVKDLFDEALVNLAAYEIYPPSLPDKCEVGHLQKLCREALENFEGYPLDKLCRWIGFVGGVLSTLSKHNDYSSSTGLVKGDLTNAAQNVLSTLFDRYLGVISRISIDSPLREELKPIETMIYDSLEAIEDCEMGSQSIRLGHVQGVLAAKGMISVDEERAFSRPLLHSLHAQPVASFP